MGYYGLHVFISVRSLYYLSRFNVSISSYAPFAYAATELSDAELGNGKHNGPL